MSNYHALMTTQKNHSTEVVFHIVVPNENNGVGVNIRTALSQSLGDVVTSIPWLENGTQEQQDEYLAIVAGEIYEYSETITYNANLNDVGKRDIIDARYTELATSIPNIIRSRFKFWGLNRDIT